MDEVGERRMNKTEKITGLIACLIALMILLGTIGVVIGIPLNCIIEWIGQYYDEINTLAVIIGGVFVLIRYNHSKKLEYTQGERRAWRNSLRNCLEYLIIFQQGIIPSIESSSEELTVKHVQARVKSNLNPNPADNSLDKLVNEQFEVIGDKENNNVSNQILALQLFLKYDWERAKKENSITFTKCLKRELDEKYRNLLKVELENNCSESE